MRSSFLLNNNGWTGLFRAILILSPIRLMEGLYGGSWTAFFWYAIVTALLAFSTDMAISREVDKRFYQGKKNLSEIEMGRRAIATAIESKMRIDYGILYALVATALLLGAWVANSWLLVPAAAHAIGGTILLWPRFTDSITAIRAKKLDKT